MYHMQLVVIQ